MISSSDFLTCSQERFFMSQWDIEFKFNFEQDFHHKYGLFTAFLFQIFTLIFRCKNCKQRLHVHLGNREYRRLLLGTPQTPSYRKRTSFFIIMWRSLKWISGRSALRTPVWAFSFGLVRPVFISLPTLEAVRRRNRERLRIIRASISEHLWVHR